MNNTIWDVIIIGGGPAGMMAAGRAAELDKSVLLLEKNPVLGKKLSITGGGRCNLTNNKPDLESLVSSYQGRPKALFSAFSQFSVEDTLHFFNSRGMETKVEAEDRVFPVSDSAESVRKVMVDYLQTGGVEVRCNVDVKGIDRNPDGHFVISGETARSCIVAAGGTSRPETGSTGDGFGWLANLGHTIIPNSYKLVPVAVKDAWVARLAGVTLTDVRISLMQNGKKAESAIGKVLFTHVGLSGPTILNMSSTIGELLEDSGVTVTLDLHPGLRDDEFKLMFNDVLAAESNKTIKNALKSLVPNTLSSVLPELTGIDPEKPTHSVSKDERLALRKLIKALPLQVSGLLGADKAIVSAGGVDINEVNFQTMESRMIKNLFVVGDMLNIDRPSGGYSLQICWSTGYVAGEHC